METLTDNTDVLIQDITPAELLSEGIDAETTTLSETQMQETQTPETQAEPQTELQTEPQTEPQTETDTQAPQKEPQETQAPETPDTDITQIPDTGEELTVGVDNGDVLPSPDMTGNADNSASAGDTPAQDVSVLPPETDGMENGTDALYYVLSDGRVVTAGELAALSDSGQLTADIPQTDGLSIIGACLTEEQKENYLAYIQSRDELENAWREDILTELSQLEKNQLSSQENLVSGIEILAKNQKEQFYAVKLTNMLVFTNMLLLFVFVGFYAAASFWRRFR